MTATQDHRKEEKGSALLLVEPPVALQLALTLGDATRIALIEHAIETAMRRRLQ